MLFICEKISLNRPFSYWWLLYGTLLSVPKCIWLKKCILTVFHMFKIDYWYLWAFWKRIFSIVQMGQRRKIPDNETFLWTQWQYMVSGVLTSSNPHPCALIFLLDSPLFFSKAHHRKSFGGNLFCNVDLWGLGGKCCGMCAIVGDQLWVHTKLAVLFNPVSYWVSQLGACGPHACI